MNRDEVRKLASSIGIKRVSSHTKPELEELIRQEYRAETGRDAASIETIAADHKRAQRTHHAGNFIPAALATPPVVGDRHEPAPATAGGIENPSPPLVKLREDAATRFDRDARLARMSAPLAHPETFPTQPDDRPGRGKFGKDPDRVAAERAMRYRR